VRDYVFIVAAMLAAFGLYVKNTVGETITAGDDEANFFEDGLDTVKSTITGYPAGAEPYLDLIQAAAERHGIPPNILVWLLWKESRYNPAIISGEKRSRVGALGIAQFMPATAQEELGSVNAALDPNQAINGAARYLAKLYRSVGAWDEALAAYNWGIGNVTRKGLANAPAETQDYYKTILKKAGMA
jgi:soluble lytic murein transglycosylase-like protein